VCSSDLQDLCTFKVYAVISPLCERL